MLVKIESLEQALAWGEEWESYARALKTELARINDELIDAKLDLWLAQSSLDLEKAIGAKNDDPGHRFGLRCDQPIAPPVPRRSPFDEPISA